VKSKTRKPRFPDPVSPMLASLVETPFSKEGWRHEPKFDGIRAIAYIKDGAVQILSRQGLNLTDRYPMLAEELANQSSSMVVDGEIVAFDDQGLCACS